MNHATTLETLARDKESLLMRSALCRLRLRREVHGLRNALPWKRAALAASAAPAIRRAAFGLALTLVGFGRAARWVMLAGRILLAAKLVRSALGYARGPANLSVCDIEQTEPGIPRSLGSSQRSKT